MNNREFGQFGENAAEEFIKRKGYSILERNYRCSLGEIDIIAMRDDEVVFLEVKTRSGMVFGDPADAVTPMKLRHMKRVASFYLTSRGSRFRNVAVRFDVIEVCVNHIEGIV